jgi:drug/metabolite transporter (DMT)-like permease
LFVLLWSTGWIVAKYASPHADPLTFLSLRFTLAPCCSPSSPSQPGRMAIIPVRLGPCRCFRGVSAWTIYLGGVWWAISKGVPSSVSGLIAALQPLLTARAAPVIVGERLSGAKNSALCLDLPGLTVAILPRLMALESAMLQIALLPLLINVFAMASVTAGTHLPEALSAGGRPALHRIAAICWRISGGGPCQWHC